MTKNQNLLKKLINITTYTVLLLSGLLSISTLIFFISPVKSDTILENGDLIPGVMSDTGQHNYSDLSSTTIHSMNSWTALGNTKENVPGANWFGMVNNGSNQAGYVIFKGAMDSSLPFSISGYFRTASGGANYKDSGDSNGFILTPESLNQINNNIKKFSGNSNTSKPVIYPTGPGLGIGGLKGSIFAGRDLYYNSPGPVTAESGLTSIDGVYDGPSSGTNVPGASPAIAIRTTRTILGTSLVSGDDSVATPGELIYGTGSTKTTGVGVNLGYPNAAGPDTNYFTLFGNNSTQDDIMTLRWSNPTLAPDGKSYTGTLTLEVQGLNSSGIASGNPVTISQTSLTIPKTLSIGTIGATGGNYGKLSFSNNSSTVTGNRGQKNVNVNYINTTTGKKIISCKTTSIKSNVGDIINVLPPNNQPSSKAGLPGKYEFVAPDNKTYTALEGYKFNKITYGGKFDDTTGVLTGDGTLDPNGSAGTNSGITVSNFDNVTNPNQINIFYTPEIKEATFTACYIGGTPGTSVVGTDKVNNINFALPSSTPNTLGFASPIPTYSSTSGYIDTIAPTPKVSNMPAGYSISKVIGSNDKVYTAETAIPAGYSDPLSHALAENPLTNSVTSVNSGVPNSFLIILAPDKHDAKWQYKYESNVPGNGSNEGISKLPILPTLSNQQGVTGLPIIAPEIIKLPPGYTISRITDNDNNSYDSVDDLTSANDFLKKYFPYIFMNVATYSGSTMNSPTFGTESSFTFFVSATPQSGKISFKYNEGTPGTDKQGNLILDSEGRPIPITDSSNGTLGIASTLPNPISLKGLTGEKFNFDLNTSIPKGYTIESVVGPDGKRYTNDSSINKTATQLALEANPYFEDSSISTNGFMIYLKAMQSIKTSISIIMDNAVTPEGTKIPENQNFLLSEGLVGSPILKTDIDNAISNLTNGGGIFDITGSVYDGWYINSLSGPQNSIITTIGEANNKIAVTKLYDLIALNPFILADGNTYTLHMNYAGMISLNIPGSIDFGAHNISGQSKIYKGNLDKNVTIVDTRTSPSPWKLKVQQFSPLIGYGEKTGMIIPNILLSGAIHFVDTQGNDTLLTESTSATVYNQTTGSNDTIEAMNKNAESKSGFYLNTLSNKQISKWYGENVTYKGTILWTIFNTP